MIDVVLGALALAAFGGLTVAADRKIKSLQMAKKKANELEDGVYFGKIVGLEFVVSRSICCHFRIRLDGGREIQISAEENEIQSILRRLKEKRLEFLSGTPVLILVELGVPSILARRVAA